MARVASIMLAASASPPTAAQSPAPPGASAAPRAHASSPAVRAQQAPADSTSWVSVWVDLDLPELASVPREQRAEREALQLQIKAQQDTVMDRLRDLGAQEQARVQQVRNALAVRLPGAQLDAARRIPGVRALRIVRNIERDPLTRGR
jgi:hypothetical protein